MSKGKKRLVIAGSAVLVVGIAFTWLTIVFTSEHPDYVNAAKGIAKARAEARNRYGYLTWQEARNATGRATIDDGAKWAALVKEMPTPLYKDWLGYPVATDYAKTFQLGRDWLLELPEQVEPLRIQHDLSGQFLHYQTFTRTKELMKVCAFALIGAADSDDPIAIRVIGAAGAAIIERIHEEPSVTTALVAEADLRIILHGIVEGAVRNRDKPKIIEALRDVIDSLPAPPDPTTVLAGEIRTQDMYLAVFKGMTYSEIDSNIETLAVEGLVPKPDRFEEFVRHVRRRMTGTDESNRRRVGRHTLEALEARSIEYVVKIDDMESSALTYEQGSRMIAKLDDGIRRSKDRSYELSLIDTAAKYREVRCVRQFQALAVRTCFQLMLDYPNASDLPLQLDERHNFLDPFTGKNVSYLRLTNGFALATLGHNQRDDGVLATVKTKPGPWAKFLRGDTAGDDWAFAVQY